MHILFNFYSLYLLEILIMKKIIFAISVFFILINCQKVKDEGYTINVEAKGGINGLRAYLKTQELDRKFTIKDTAIIINENFKFKGNTLEPKFQYLFVDNYDSRLPVIITNEDFKIILNKNNLSNSTFINSTINNNLKDYISKINAKEDSLFEQRKAIDVSVSLKDSITLKKNIDNYLNTAQKLLTYNTNYIKNNPKSPVSLFIFQKSYISGIFPLDSLNNQYNLLDNSLKQTLVANQIIQQLSFKKGQIKNQNESK